MSEPSGEIPGRPETRREKRRRRRRTPRQRRRNFVTLLPQVLTTGNLACIDLDIESWRELGAARGTLRFVLRPRKLA